MHPRTEEEINDKRKHDEFIQSVSYQIENFLYTELSIPPSFIRPVIPHITEFAMDKIEKLIERELKCTHQTTKKLLQTT